MAPPYGSDVSVGRHKPTMATPGGSLVVDAIAAALTTTTGFALAATKARLRQSQAVDSLILRKSEVLFYF